MRSRIKTAHGHAGHALNPAANKNFPCAHLDRACCHMNGLHGRAAETIDRCRCCCLGKPGKETDNTGDIQALLGLREGTADDHIFNIFLVDTRLLKETPDNLACQFIGANFDHFPFVCECEGGACITGNYDVLHYLDFLSDECNWTGLFPVFFSVNLYIVSEFDE